MLFGKLKEITFGVCDGFAFVSTKEFEPKNPDNLYKNILSNGEAK